MNDDKISIIITCYMRHDFSKNLVESIGNSTDYQNYEILAVNTYPTHNKHLTTYLDKMDARGVVKHVRRGDDCLRYMEGCEEGYKVSEGSYVLLLNDDCLISAQEPKWLTKLYEFMQPREDIGTTACYQYLHGKRLYTTGEHDHNKPGHTHGTYAFLRDLPKEKEVLWNPFSCALFRRSFIEDNRFLDVVPPEQYHYGSDSCYCNRIIERGLKNVLINRTWIYHFNNRNLKGKVERYTYNGI